MQPKTAKEHRNFRITRTQKNHIDELFARHGGMLSEEKLIASARPEKSPIHDLIPWDMKENSRLYQLRVAARVLRSYAVMKVKYSESSETITQVLGPIAIKVRHTEDGPKVFTSTRIVLESEELSARAMAEMISRVRTWNKQLLVFPKLVALHEQLEAVIAAYKIEKGKNAAVN